MFGWLKAAPKGVREIHRSEAAPRCQRNTWSKELVAAPKSLPFERKTSPLPFPDTDGIEEFPSP